MVDVGYQKDSTDSKIKEYLQTYTRFPQTLRVFFGGGQSDASGYLSTFSALEKEQMLGKIVILRSSDEVELDSRLPSLPRLTVEGVFMTEKPSGRGFQKLSPLTSPARIGGRMIDPLLPLHRQNPPPCNEHYLMTCSKGAAICKYSHEYTLTPEQLAMLASNAKKAPCNWLKNGVQCPYGDNCCWGHFCPNGPKCFHLSKGKCWFKGGYKPSAVKSADEYAQLDANDESLARWKASLGIVPGATGGTASGPKVTVLTLELDSPTLPAGKKIAFDLKDTTANLTKNPITIKEGVEYNVRITFRGVRYIQLVKRAGLKVDKLEQMLGSYGPNPEGEFYTKNFEPEESPSGMLVRTGSYNVRSRVIDDDGEVYAGMSLLPCVHYSRADQSIVLDWEWSFKLAKEW
ncbi:hypothetical protein H0H87_011556 [Tephrocybe sp. NHM501043]|nr:hypothetical protein H0H87_011556 [Tephrocybe sp. NHM501043]